MIQRAILLGALLAAAVCAAADVGDLTYVACDPKEAVDASTLYRQGRSSAAPPKNSGIVNPQAAVLQFTGVSLRIRVAIDSAKPDVRVPDLVRFDFSGAGRFKDADVVALVRTRTSARGTLYTGKFGPKVLHVKHGGRAIPVTVQGDYHKSGTYRRISLSLGAAVQGTCAFGKKTHAVRIIDGNHNLSFGDPPKAKLAGNRIARYEKGDTLVIDTGDGTFKKAVRKYFYGQPVHVDGAWYQVKVSPDGSKVAARPIELKAGRIRIGHDHWSCTFAGNGQVFHLSTGAEAVDVPAGRYMAMDYTEYTGDDSDARRGELNCARQTASGRRPTVFGVSADKLTEVAIGSPMTASVTVSRQGRSVRLNLKLVDASGLKIDSLFLPGRRRPAPPKVVVSDASGREVYKATLEYG